MFRIGDFSRLCQISIRMLRHYDDIGLLKPDETDEMTGYRYYSAKKFYDVNRIKELKDIGFGLKTILEILNQYDDRESFKKYLTIHYSQVKEDAETAERRLMLIKTTIEKLERNGDSMEYNVTLKKFQKQHVAGMRKIMPNYQSEGELWKVFHKSMHDMKVKTSDKCYTSAVFYDEGYKETDVDVEVQMSVVGNYNDGKGLVFKDIQEVEVASTIMKGSYENTNYACEAIGQWIADNGYEIAGQTFIIYLTNPSVETNPENYVSEVCFPVKKIK